VLPAKAQKNDYYQQEDVMQLGNTSTTAVAETVPLRRLGATGPTVSALGLGTMGMSDFYGPADRGESITTIRAALDAGVTLLDTGDFYGSGHNELLIREALTGLSRDSVVLSVKFGALRDPAGGWGGVDNRPAAVKNYLAQTLQRLGTDYVDVYRPARLDRQVPIEDTAGAVGEMIAAGYVRHLGLSEVSAETIRRAHAVQPVADVQIEYSLVSRGPEREVIAACRELGIAVTAYGVLSRGLISGHWSRSRQGQRDFRAMSPRFQGENLERNLGLVERLRKVADAKGATVAQLAIAWVLSRGKDVVPLVGARNRERLGEALGALHLNLSDADLTAIETAIPKDGAAGERYPAQGMADLDSERATDSARHDSTRS
jgi:pyridoxine 4-dehydrogenase